jgi:outer membrane biosynthesis protein TonB
MAWKGIVFALAPSLALHAMVGAVVVVRSIERGPEHADAPVRVSVFADGMTPEETESLTPLETKRPAKKPVSGTMERRDGTEGTEEIPSTARSLAYSHSQDGSREDRSSTGEQPGDDGAGSANVGAGFDSIEKADGDGSGSMRLIAPKTGALEEQSVDVPPHVLARAKISGRDPSLPPSVRSRYRGQTIRVVLLVCITQTGEVDRRRTRILSSVPGTDGVVLRAVQAWRYQPTPIPICGRLVFNFNIVD